MVADAGYRGITVDLRGHGDSTWADDGDYLLDAYARDIEHIIDGLERPAALVGASRGGQAALVAASRRPSRLALVMLADVAPMLRDAGVDIFRAFFRASEAGFASLDDAADALAEHLHQPRMTDASGLRRAMRIGGDGRFYWQWDPRTAAPEMLNPPSEGRQLQAAAARVDCPVIMVRAELSGVVTDEGVATFHRLTPQLEVIEAKGVGHMFTGDQNDAFAERLLDQLARYLPLP